MSSLRARWRREQFDPTALGLLVNPFYFARSGLRARLAPLLSSLEGEVLDVGCGAKPYRELAAGATSYTGLDLDTPESRAQGVADVFYEGGVFPFGDESFDAVLCSQVLEHVFEPDDFIREIRRVLRPGGRLVLTVPFAWSEHERPRDYARYTSFGLPSLLERGGFEVVTLEKSVTGIRALVQLAAATIDEAAGSRPLPVKLAVQFLVIAPLNLLGAVAARGFRDDAFYLDNVVLARVSA